MRRSVAHDQHPNTAIAIEYATLEWVQWHNDVWLHNELDHLSPQGYEECHRRTQIESAVAA